MNENRKSVKDKMEQYKNCPNRTRTYELGGIRYHVTSHFIGVRDLDETMNKLALEAAMREEKITA